MEEQRGEGTKEMEEQRREGTKEMRWREERGRITILLLFQSRMQKKK